MFGIGATELILILVLALIFIGPKKLPEVARTFGKTYRELQHALEGIRRDFAEAGDSVRHEVESTVKEVAPPAAPVPPPAGSVETRPALPDAPVGSVEKKSADHPGGPDPARG
ncbi:MAG: twin-arginine translocase TatA/TatE family subunit [Nitrospinae bacterium]|nr:twin-arginine translocase TatA/TatE family subunit [Nitrospinota bacterium]